MPTNLLKQFQLLITLVSIVACRSSAEKRPTHCEHVLNHTGSNLGEVSGLHHESTAYFVDLTIGNANQTVSLIADTGSANLIVPGGNSICSTCSAMGKQYTPGASAAVTSDQFTASYGSGHAEITTFEDDVVLTCGVPVRNKVGVVTSQAGLQAGILGLANKEIMFSKDPTATSFLDTLTSKTVTKDQFTMRLCGFGSSSSRVTFGGLSKERSGTSPVTIPMARGGYYSVPIITFSSENGKHLGDTSVSSLEAIVDSGTTLVLVPSVVFSNLKQIILSIAAQNNVAEIDEEFLTTDDPTSAKYLVTLTDSQIALFPTFYVTVVGSSGKRIPLAIKPQRYFKKISESKRIFGFRQNQMSDEQIVLGQVFMENYEITFNRGNSTFEFEPSDNLCK